jgi:hypothetical protein
LEPDVSPAGAFAALGYAKRWLTQGMNARSDDVLKELREGECDLSDLNKPLS